MVLHPLSLRSTVFESPDALIFKDRMPIINASITYNILMGNDSLKNLFKK